MDHGDEWETAFACELSHFKSGKWPPAGTSKQGFPSLVQSIGSSGLEHWIASNASTVEDEALDNTLSVGEVITKIRRRPR
ncbi:gag protein, partial [Colletotrichum musicola]